MKMTDNQLTEEEFEAMKKILISLLRQGRRDGNVVTDRNGQVSTAFTRLLFDDKLPRPVLILATPGLAENVGEGVRFYCNEANIPLVTILDTSTNNEVANQKLLYSLLHPELSSEEISIGHDGLRPEEYPKLLAIRAWDESSEDVSSFLQRYDSLQEQQPSDE